ncbi:uncharacterized protein TNCV_3309291, partial [Trichonephila clavipes]
TRTTPIGGNSEAERRPVRSRQATAVRPCPYYLRSRVKYPEGIPEEQRSNGIDSIPQNNLRRRSLSMEILDGDRWIGSNTGQRKGYQLVKCLRKLESWRIEHEPDDHVKEARAPCIAVEMEAIASEAASGPAVHVKMPDDWSFYHHHLSAIFFVESSSCTHKNCNRAMNFCQQIPHRGKHLQKWAFSKMGQGSHLGFNILWTD